MHATTTHFHERHAKLGIVILRLFPKLLQMILKGNITPKGLNTKYRNKNLHVALTDAEIALLEQLPNTDQFTAGPCYKILRFEHLIDEPKCEWKSEPHDTELDIASDIQRMLCRTNELLSKETNNITKDYYTQFIKKVEGVVSRVDTYLEQDTCQTLYQEILVLMGKNDTITCLQELANIQPIDEIKISSTIEECKRCDRVSRIACVIIDKFASFLRLIINMHYTPSQIYSQVAQNLSTFTKAQHRSLKDLQTLHTFDSLDITLMYQLLRQFSLIYAPSKGWGRQPNSSDLSIADDIERIRILRNKFAHQSDIKMDQNTFENYFSQFRDISHRIDVYLGNNKNPSCEQEIINCKTCHMAVDYMANHETAPKRVENIKNRYSQKVIFIVSERSKPCVISNTSMDDIKRNKLLVVAIDFGTTYSGCAYCTRHDYEDYLKNKKDHPKIQCPTWKAGGGMKYKDPTCVLFKPDNSFHSFGYDAQSYYQNNSDKEDFTQWFYFEQFKMMWYKEKDELTKDTWLKESIYVKGGKYKKMKAVDVFAAVIGYFQGLIMNKLLKGHHGHGVKTFSNDDIHWVLTIPAIWDLKKGKQFIRDAAKKVKISNDQLTLALEPEAASIHCRRQPVSIKTQTYGKRAIAGMQKGHKYVVFDQGGGTTDITVYEVTGPNSVKEIYQACGGHWGGITVNGEFYKFLVRLLGGDVINAVKEHHPVEYYDLMHNFECAKTNFKEGSRKVNVRLPFAWLTKYEEITEDKLKEVILQTNFHKKITIVSDKLRIDHSLFRSFFDYSIVNVTDELGRLFRKELSDVQTLFAVGGFSESSILIDAIKEKLGPEIDVFIPRDPGLAVLKGAVMCGFEPEIINSHEHKNAHFELFATEVTDPKYTTESECKMISVLSVDLTRNFSKDGGLSLKINASGIEIVAVVNENATKN
ncbi:unnamed protein product [Mytilus coruscus]|uniref:DZIP3-like HEPN domain-containing protein n=1 Tax=Mytilus coruscus TaxID=42192 RepID=A0A6J8DJZ8_MYTCO|nr:unnamed protein product [Mytilus coruscus]